MTAPSNQTRMLDLLTDSTGSLTPTLRVSAGAAGVGQTLKNFNGFQSVVAGATVPMETVAAGKTLYLTDIYVSGNTSTQFQVSITANGVSIFSGYCKGDTGSIQMAGMETQPSAPAGSVVQLVLGTAAATTASYQLMGFEQ